MTQNNVSRKLQRIYCTENQLLTIINIVKCEVKKQSKTKKRSTTILEMNEGYSS